MNTVQQEFTRELQQAASAVQLAIDPANVACSLLVRNPRTREATACFRVTASADVLPQLAALAGFQRQYATLDDGAQPLRLTCTLVGAQVNGHQVDWAGNLTEAVG